ncbi:hypothetical protein, partial [Ktedonospora formicarum]|uniref:hypothetical protein n=1 Tax=Ktedonospora formicarum TaxID=2778364 RepID=UPI001C68DEF7
QNGSIPQLPGPGATEQPCSNLFLIFLMGINTGFPGAWLLFRKRAIPQPARNGRISDPACAAIVVCEKPYLRRFTTCWY